MDNKKSCISVEWCISGYHNFKVKPENGELLRLHREPDNKFDPWAVLVKRKDGTTVGRVPANLCRTLFCDQGNQLHM